MPDAVDWLAQYLDYLSERGCSAHTVASYRYDLEQFQRSLSGDLLEATTDDVTKFMVASLAINSPNTAARAFFAIRGFYRFVLNEEGISANPTRCLKAPRLKRALVRAISGREVDTLLESMKAETAVEIRDRAMLYVAFGSGLRVSEIIKLRVGDLDFPRHIVRVNQGKGLKDRLAPLNEREMEALTLWLEKGRPRYAPGADNDVLFLGRKTFKGRFGRPPSKSRTLPDLAQPITRQRADQIFAAVSERELARRISPHKYRHAFVTETIRGGADIRVVQAMAGHASPNTTMHYLHSDPERLRTEYLKAHPRGGVCKPQLSAS